MKNEQISAVITNVTKSPNYTPERVASLIKRLEISEKAFALIMNVTPAKVKLWLAGAVTPRNLSKRLMRIYEICPAALTALASGSERL
jgi:DNA-binding transcriptional regulator YiaG